DLDGDGFRDVCARDDTGLVCYRGHGDSFETTPIRGPAWAGSVWGTKARYFRSVTLVDLNGDGLADVCANSPTNGLECYMGSVNGFAQGSVLTIPLPSADPDIGDAFSSLMMADINGDGKTDICVFQKEGMKCYESDFSNYTDLLQASHLTTGQTWTI